MLFAAIMAVFVENSIQSIDFMPIHLFKNSSSFQLQFDHVANSECFFHFADHEFCFSFKCSTVYFESFFNGIGADYFLVAMDRA
jgi:hypothetical protein